MCKEFFSTISSRFPRDFEITVFISEANQTATTGTAMPDIRGDPQQRADLALDRMKALDPHFKRRLEMLRQECDANVSELVLVLSTILKRIEFENRRSNRLTEIVPLPQTARTRSGGPTIKLAECVLSNFSLAADEQSLHQVIYGCPTTATVLNASSR